MTPDSNKPDPQERQWVGWKGELLVAIATAIFFVMGLDLFLRSFRIRLP